MNQANWPDSGYQIPELNAGETHTFQYTHLVENNQNFDVLELVGSNAALNEDFIESANFRFMPRKPFIEVNPLTDPAEIDFNTSGEIQIEVINTNAGDGPARDFKLKTNIPSAYNIIDLSSNWIYNAAESSFEYNVNGGNFPDAESGSFTETISFKLESTDPLNQSGGTITLQAEYTDDEDNPFSRPFETFDYNVTGIPSLSIESSASTTADHTDTDRMYLGEEISYTYTVSLTEFDKFTDDDIELELTNFDDTRLSYLSYDSNGIGTFDPTTKIWTLAPSDLDGQDQSITIDFKITDDQTKAKTTVLTAAEVRGELQLTDNSEIPIADNTANSFYLQSRYNEVDLNQQTKEIVNLPDEGSFDYTRTDNKHRVEYVVSYSFGNSSAGTWTGSTITDDLDKNQLYNDSITAAEGGGFIRYSTDQGSSWNEVPAASVIPTIDELKFELDFLQNVLGSDSVAGQTVYFKYKLEVTENGAIDSWTTLNLNGVEGENDFYQVVKVPVTGANANLDIDVLKNGSTANDIDKGELVDLKIDITKNPWMIKDLKVRVDPGGFTYGDYSDIKNSGDIEITGFGNYSPDISYDSTNELIIFDFSGAGEFIDTGLGTITLNNMIKDCSETFTAGAELDYRHGLIDSTEDPITKTDQSQVPLIKRESDLIITAVNPVIVTEETVTWTIDITNTDIGTAHNAEFIGTFSELFDYQSSQIDSSTVTPILNGEVATWDLGKIESGATKQLQITADITDADSRTFKDFSSAFSSEVKWYTEEVNNKKYECGNNIRNDFPKFLEPIKNTDLVVENNLVSPAEINICSEGFMGIIVKNTGQTRNYNLELRQDFLTTGITFDETEDITVTDQNGSTTYSISSVDLEDLDGNLVFKEETFPELEAIDIGEEIKIEFAIKTNGDFNASNEIQPAVSWNPPSKYKQDEQGVIRNGSIYKIPRIRPEINIDLKVRNETIGETEFVDNPAAMAGKNTILWKLDIENIGAGDAGNVWIASSDFPSNTVLYSDDTLQNSVDNNDSDNYWIVSDLAAGESKSYYLEYDVPAASTALEEINADVNWGCDDNNRLSTPGKSSDKSTLTTVPDITFSHQNLNDNLTRKDGTIVLTMVNTGAPIYNLDFDYNLSDRYKLSDSGIEYNVVSSTGSSDKIFDWSSINIDPNPDDILNNLQWEINNGTDNNPIPAGTYEIKFDLVHNGTQISDLANEITSNKITANYDSSDTNEEYTLKDLTPKYVDLSIDISPKKQVISDLANDVEWTISVKNDGNTKTINTKVEQEIGDGFDYTNLSYTLDSRYRGDNFSYSLDSDNGILSWTDIEIPTGESAEIIVTTKMLADGSHINTVQADEISTYNDDIESFTETVSAYTAAFNLNKELITDPPNSGYFAPGEIVEYQVTADLIGDLDYKNLTIVDNLPEGLEVDTSINDYTNDSYQSSSPNLNFTNDDKLEWMGTIDGSSNDQIIIDYKLRVIKEGGVSRGTSVENIADVSFDIDFANDNDDSNDISFNTDEDITNKAALEDKASFTFQEPELSITREATPTEINAGTNVNHTITISNSSEENISPAYEIKIIESVPEGFRDKISDIADTDNVIVKNDGINLTKGSDYNLSYDNTDNNLAIELLDKTNTVLHPGNELIITYDSKADGDISAGNDYKFRADIAKYYSLESETNNVASYPDSNIDLKAEKTLNSTSSSFKSSVDKTELSPGDKVTFTLDFEVPAKTTINSFDLSAQLPEGLKFISNNFSGPGNPTGINDKDLGTWEPDDSNLTGDPENGGQTIVFPNDNVTVTNSSDLIYKYSLSFEAKVLNIDSVRNKKELNSSFTYQYNSSEDSDNLDLKVIEPDLVLNKNFAAGSYETGDTIDYTITVNHSGNSTAAAYDLVVEDIIPDGMTYVSDSMTKSVDSLSITANDSGPDLSWTIEQLAQTYDSTNRLELAYQVTVDADVRGSIELENQFGVNWYSQSGNVDEQREYSQSSSVILTTIPDLTINDQLTNNNTPTITGTTNPEQAGNTVAVIVDGVEYNPVVDGNGDWKFDIPEENQLSEGEYNVEAVITDDSPGSGTRSATGTLKADLTAPLIEVEDKITNDTTPEITGTSDEIGREVKVTVNGKEYTATVENDGIWGTDIPEGDELAEGNYIVDAEITDEAGNKSTDSAILEVDTTDPLINVDSEITNDTTPPIMGTTDEPEGSKVNVEVKDEDGNSVFSGEVIVDKNGNWEIESDELAEGNYDVTAEITDEAGNKAVDTATIEIDTTLPDIAVDDKVTKDTTPVLTGITDEPVGSDVIVSVRDINGNIVFEGIGEVVANKKWSLDTTGTANTNNWANTENEFPDGNYDIRAEITDGSGNTAVNHGFLTVDTNTPSLNLDNNAIKTNDTTPEITGTSDEIGGYVKVTVNGKEYTATVENDGTWIIEISEGDELAEGDYTVTAITEDEAGNTAETNGDLEIDLTEPEIDLDDDNIVTNDQTPTIEGTSNQPENSDVEVVITDGKGNEVFSGTIQTTDADGNWSIDIPEENELAEGDYTVTAITEDEAGNTAETNGDLEIDLTEPEIALDDNDMVTKDQTPTIEGTSNQPENSDVEVVITDGKGNEVFSGTVKTDADGSWSIDVPEGNELAEGNYNVEATTEDEAGNSATANGDLEIDITPPVLIVDDQAANDTTPTITGSTDEPAGSTVEVFVRDDEGNLIFEGEALVEEDGSWSINTEEKGNWSEQYDQFSEGDYIVEAEITDEVGNTTTAEGNLEIDLTEPEIEVIDNQTNSNTPTITGTTDEPAGSTVDVVIRDEDGEIVFEGEAEVNEDGIWSIDVDQPLDLGEYEVEASITDDAGNTSTTTGVLEVYPTDIIINKTAAEKQVSIGDFISYKIEIINETDFDLESFTLYDKLPAGFKFVKDSAVIVSETGSETKLKTEGNRLVSWEGLELNAESSMEIRYTLVVGSGVVNSNIYVNQAYAKVEENLISNTAEAEVLVIEDPLFTTSTIIGKVYLDQNEDGMQTEVEAEKGLGGIRIISTTGQIVETDQFGRFHFEIEAEDNIQLLQTLVLKLDKKSLPAGAEIISKNPVIVKIREGLMSEVNFRIKYVE